MTDRRRELRFRAVGLLGGLFVRGLFLTTRVEWQGEEHYLRFRRTGQPVMFVFWHGQLLPLLYHHRGRGIVVLVSDHADGEYVTRVIERMGFATARGSSTRGGTKGLKGLIRAAREGRDLGVSPDGPRGPACVFKPGALMAASLTGLPVIPVAASASSAWRLPSWDRFQIPRPLARVRLGYGPPHFIPRGAGEAELAERALELEATLERMTRALERGPEEHRPAKEVGV